MEGRPCTLEITVISGENLCIDGKPVRENAYVVVRAESLKCYTTKMAAESKSNGENSSSFLSWNEKLSLEMSVHARCITFEVQCKTSKGVDRDVGVARIAVSDFMGESANCMKVLSYGLRDWDGRRNGVIHFSVRVKMPEEKEKGMTVSSGGLEAEVMGFEVNDEKSSNGVVIGIPLWWSYT
ncbi:C2 domain [Sesbania bispinosa]|nr:C2 domain [Sesbania bispinosa]